MQAALIVALGGAFGAACRYGLVMGLSALGLTQSPWPVLMVNVLGCAAFGWLSQHVNLPPTMRLMVLTGVLGGFTTFSSYVHDAHTSTNTWVWLSVSPVLGYAAYWLASR